MALEPSPSKDFPRSSGWAPRRARPSRWCAIGQANALLQGRDYVIPEDVKAFAHEVLRHRILMTFEALADGVTSDQVVDSIVQAVPVP